MRSSDDTGTRRARPTPELMDRLRQGKASLRARRRGLSPPEKIRELLVLQRFMLPLLARRRALRSWERPWQIEP